ncbi:MAG: hypothetical protein ACKVQA_18800 [Burkholderiales bacterium]
MTIKCNVTSDRTITVSLPAEVEPGPHELVIVLDQIAAPESQDSTHTSLMSMAGSVPSLASLDAIAYQRSLRDEWQ